MADSADFEEFMKAFERLCRKIAQLNRRMDKNRATGTRQSRHSRGRKSKADEDLVSRAKQLKAAAQKQLEVTLARKRELKKRDRLRSRSSPTAKRRTARHKS